MSDSILEMATERFAAASDAIERIGGGLEPSRQEWARLEEEAWTTVGLPESLGGGGGTLLDAVRIGMAAGRAALPLPMAEAAIVGSEYARLTGHALQSGVVSFADATRGHLVISDGLVRGTLTSVPWAELADRIVVLADGVGPLVVERADCELISGSDLAGSPLSDLVLDGVPSRRPVLGDQRVVEALWAARALSYAALIAGAMQETLALSTRYASEREQFGRPIAKFQAVQQHLVTIAEAAALVTMAVEAAALSDPVGEPSRTALCAALLADRWGERVTASAHQVHGAIGMTREYRLHNFTRRIWAWQRALGPDHEFASRIADAFAFGDGASPYEILTDLA